MLPSHHAAATALAAVPLFQRNWRRSAVGQHAVGMAAEAFDVAEDLVPAPDVEAGGALADLPQDLLHLERRRQGLDEKGHPQRSTLELEPVLETLE